MKYCKNYCEKKEISTSKLNEAQKTLYYIAENMKMNKSIGEEGYKHFQMAIQVLEQEPSEDCISREKATQFLYERLYRLNDEELYDIFSRIIDDMYNELPSVTPQPKTGYWVLADEQNKEEVENDNYRFICSECQCSDIHSKGTKVPYCWKCGAKMVEPQESEVKENE